MYEESERYLEFMPIYKVRMLEQMGDINQIFTSIALIELELAHLHAPCNSTSILFIAEDALTATLRARMH